MEHPMPEFSEQELNELFPKGFTGWNFEHASHLETSIMLVLRPELVRRDLIADDHAARAPSWDVVPAPDEFVPRSGVLMKPTHASEEAGKRFLEASVGRLVEAIGTEFAAR
jgi:creatinine amidohydrolase